MCFACVRHVAGPFARPNMSSCRMTLVNPAPHHQTLQLSSYAWISGSLHAHKRPLAVVPSPQRAVTQTLSFRPLLSKSAKNTRWSCGGSCFDSLLRRRLILHTPFKSCWAILPFRLACSKKVSSSCLEILPRNHPSRSAVTVAPRMWSTSRFLEFPKVGG